MKKWKAWLLPGLTCLVVLAAILLPRQLSRLRDQRELGGVHTEALTADNHLPAKSLTLTERIELLARWSEEPEALAIVQQELTEPAELEGLEETVQAELESLADGGVIPSELLPEALSPLYGTRLYLRDAQYLAGARFLIVENYYKEIHLWLALDEESGHALQLELGHPAMKKLPNTPADLGTAFLDRLGIENELLGGGDLDAVLVLPENGLQYAVLKDSYYLSILPVSDWLPDSGATSEAAVYDSGK